MISPASGSTISALAWFCSALIERFDRARTRDGRLLRRPQEDCCQARGVPPTRKYQNEGGPGIIDILDLLKSADDPDHDRALFLKAQIVFWLLAATDGHAKNFSIRLSPGARFSMTPLYDVISVQPSLNAGQLQRKACKLAMSIGSSNHYRVDEIMPRHFVETGERAGMSKATVEALFDELSAAASPAVESVMAALPKDFPLVISEQIMEGFEKRLKLLNG